MKRRKKSENKKLKDKLDVLWSEYAKARVGYKCEYCGKSGNLNSHHIYSRSNYSVRWSELNSVCLCAFHHMLSSEFSAHKTPTDFTDWLYTVRSIDIMDGLRVMKNHVIKVESIWLDERIEYFKKKLQDFHR